MTDFRSMILTNLRICRDTVENPDWVEALNDTLNALDAAGFGKLVQNFCAQPDPEQTWPQPPLPQCGVKPTVSQQQVYDRVCDD
jgi:hypothetical protein